MYSLSEMGEAAEPERQITMFEISRDLDCWRARLVVGEDLIILIKRHCVESRRMHDKGPLNCFWTKNCTAERKRNAEISTYTNISSLSAYV